MTTAAIRQRLITYLADAEPDKVKALYLLLEKEMDSVEEFSLTEEQFHFLKQEREMHLNNQTQSYTRQQSSEIIRGQRDF